MLLKRDTIAADGRHARTVLRCSDASDLCLSQVSSLVAKLSKHPIPTDAMNGQDKDDDGCYDKDEEGDILVIKAG